MSDLLQSWTGGWREHLSKKQFPWAPFQTEIFEHKISEAKIKKRNAWKVLIFAFSLPTISDLGDGGEA